ncbi:MAG: ATP-binding protein [Bacteroidota bacterium]
MVGKVNIAEKQIGIVTQIVNDERVDFVINNNEKCDIGDIVGLEVEGEIYVLAEIFKIDVEFYLENVRQFFISKAVDNDINRIGDPNLKPRYGQHIQAKILGHYKLSEEHQFVELKTTINKYTPYIFQKVYAMAFSSVLDVYGLCTEADHENRHQNFTLGTISFPFQHIGTHVPYFNIDLFKKHTLITGVTGSGKSRLAALIIKKLAKLGGHINILDPHNEYYDLLVPNKGFQINRLDQHNITFSENFLNADILTKLLPNLTQQQELEVYDIFNSINFENVTVQKFMDVLLAHIVEEVERDFQKEAVEIKDSIVQLKRKTKNDVEFFSYLIGFFRKKLSDNVRATKLSVIIAVASKVNDLRENNFFNKEEPNWLKKSPNSIDIFNIDYGANESIRRFINSIIQFLLRKREIEELRALVIDEAHLLLTDTSQTEKLLKRLLREARKFNITVIFISQNLSDIPEDIRSQFQNHFQFRQKENELTKYYSDQMCMISLFGSKLSFSMKIADVKSVSE